MRPNPYQASAVPIALDSQASYTTDDTCNALMRDWETRRLTFNAILIAVTVLFGALPGFIIFERRFWAFVVQGAVIANICFCAGPVVTWHLSRLGFDRRALTATLFWLGTIFSVPLTVVSLFVNLVPWQD